MTARLERTTADRYVPDHNPLLPCTNCGTEARWQSIKASGDWQVSNDRDVPFLCPECMDGSEQATTDDERRRRENHQLSETGGEQ